MIRHAAPLIAVLLLTGCMMGPDYKPPALPAGAAGPLATPSPGTSSEAPADAWWRLYDDPVLDELVARAFAANTDLRVANANLRRARGFLAESRTARLPATTISGSATQSQQVILLPTGATAFSTDFYRLGLDASYEIDLYGRVGRSVQAARADADAVLAERDATMVSVAAETTRAYADACSLSAQLAVARQSLAIQRESFRISEARVDAGRDSPLDLARARAQLASTEASLPDLEAGRQAALNRLAVLTGQPPAAVDARAAACTAPPRLAQPIPVGDGTMLLARRPDIRAANRRYAGALARIGVAKADFLPRITLGGSISGQGVNPGDVFSSRGFGWSVGPQISWGFPNIIGNAARVRQARAGSDAALAAFDGVVLNALKETETALSDHAAMLARNAALRRARDESAEAARIVRLRGQVGRESFLSLLDAERTLATAEAALAASDAAVVTAQIALFKALGGGWQAIPPAPTG